MAEPEPTAAPLWAPSAARIAASRTEAFRRGVERTVGIAIPDSTVLHAWSTADPAAFWSAVWDFADVVADSDRGCALRDPTAMPGARFFPDARLNFAENLLRGDGDGDAIVFSCEGGPSRRSSWDALRAEVASLAAVLADAGVGPGDRVAGFLPNIPEAVTAMLATAALGATWTSCSPDFGVRGVVDRFAQVEPVVLLCADGYRYKGRDFDSLTRVGEILVELPSVVRTLVVPYLEAEPDVTALPDAELLPRALARHPDAALEFTRVGFNDPLYVLYSSGTTGAPKCIVHGVGGTLLKHLAEHQLMCDVRPGDRVFYFTTCGWMMWNWLASALASEATVLLYDGNPMAPSAEVLFAYAQRERATLFGTSAKYIDAIRESGLDIRAQYPLESLRTIASTGSPLSPESFDTVYTRVKNDVCLSSISGGTDIVGCFVGGDPLGPVWRGEIQAAALGMAVDVYDDDGRSLARGKGELVCTKPFPSMPLGFWGDPEGTRYHAAYFERFEGVWHQGDFAEWTEHGGLIIHGRSDATLNPGGVRIGTAEIYRVVEDVAGVREAVVIGQTSHADVRVVLFVVLSDGLTLDDAMRTVLRDRIRAECSPRHVPARILQVPDIPRTRSGKLAELAVRDVVHGRPVVNLEALANPAALEHFADLDALRD